MSATLAAGSCHCGAVRFAVRLNTGMESFRCNCSICTKSRAWLTVVPAADFTLTCGEFALTEYQFGKREISHYFCSQCGIKIYGRIGGEAGVSDFVAVNVAALELSPSEFVKIPISYSNGREDEGQSPPAITSYL